MEACRSASCWLFPSWAERVPPGDCGRPLTRPPVSLSLVSTTLSLCWAGGWEVRDKGAGSGGSFWGLFPWRVGGCHPAVWSHRCLPVCTRTDRGEKDVQDNSSAGCERSRELKEPQAWPRKPILSTVSRWIALEGFSRALGAGSAKPHAKGTEVQ